MSIDNKYWQERNISWPNFGYFCLFCTIPTTSFQLYLDPICIGFIHILQTLTALKSWSPLRAVLQLCSLIFDKKESDPEKKIFKLDKSDLQWGFPPQSCTRSPLPELRNSQSKGCRSPQCLLGSQSKSQANLRNKVWVNSQFLTGWEFRLTRGSASITGVCC